METTRRRYPIVALLLALVMPGVGQMYNGRLARGVVFFIGFLIVWIVFGLTSLPYTFSGACVWVLCAVAVYLVVLVDAVLGSVRVREIQLTAYNRWYYYVIAIAICAVAADSLDFLFTDLLNLREWKTFRMPASSMEPTISGGDCFVARINPDRIQAPARNEVVVFPFPEDTSKMFVKRIVGLAGEELEIRDKKVYVNDKPLEEPWAIYLDRRSMPRDDGPRDNLGPLTVPSGAVFVMGDNRDYSHDSRFWGSVPWKDIEGEALYIYWSKDWERIGRAVK